MNNIKSIFMQEKINELDTRLKALENLHKYGIGTIIVIGVIYLIIKK